MRKLSLLLAGFLCAITVGVGAQQSTIGGQTTRPRFQSVGINQAAPALGGLSMTGSLTAGTLSWVPGTNTLALGSDATPGVVRSVVSNNGHQLVVAGGDCNGAGNTCAGLLVRAGEQTANEGNGGPLTVRAGHGRTLIAQNRSGGDLHLLGGDSSNAAQAGNVNIGAGTSPTGIDGVINFSTNSTVRGTLSGAGIMNWLLVPTRAGNVQWDQGNDGNGSGLDADMLDGLSGNITCNSGPCDVVGMLPGQQARASKDLDETRTSTTTPSADSDLLFTNVPTGKYSLRLFLSTDNSTSTGVSVQLSHPTQVDDIDMLGMNNCNSTITNALVQSSAAGPQTVLLCTATNDEGTASQTWSFELSASGSLTILWAQQTSSATATIMRRRSWIELTMIG